MLLTIVLAMNSLVFLNIIAFYFVFPLAISYVKIIKKTKESFMSEIKVKRGTGFVGIIGKFPVFIDGQKVGAIKNGEEVVFPIAANEAEVRAGSAPMKTKPVTVKAGQTLLIETNFTNFSVYLVTLVVALLFGGWLRVILLILCISFLFLLPFYTARIAE